MISTRLADFLERFENARRDASGGWMARCSAHEDGRPSLHISEGEEGRILLKCFAGCATQDIVAAVGLTLADLMPPKPERPERRIVEAYEYQDADGTPLFETVRFAPKDFRQRQINGPWNLNGVKRVLYRLPDVLKAIQDGKPIWLTEGEKDADHLHLKCGVIATTNPMGAGKWREEYTQALKGAPIVEIVEDQDDPGRAHAAAVARSLRAAGIPCTIRRPLEGKDAWDHLHAGHPLRSMTVAPETPEIVEPEAQPNGHTVNGREPTRWSLESITAPELLVGDDDLVWLVQDVLAAGMPCMIGGPFKGFKTSVLVDLAVSLTTGAPFLGKFRVPEPVPVLFVSAESGRPTIRRTLRRILKSKGIEASELLTFSFKCPKLTRPESLLAIEEELERTGARVIILDPFYLMLDGGTKSENLFSMGSALSGVAELCGEVGVTLILAHHFNRPGVRQTDPPTLVDLTMTGVAEYARQWMLLGWRQAYDAPTRQGYLWLNMGVAGWSGELWELDINEGAPDCSPDDRLWSVELRKRGDPANAQRIIDAVLKYLSSHYPAAKTANDIKNHAPGAKGADNIKPVCTQMVYDGLLEHYEIPRGNNNTYPGFRITARGQVEADALRTVT